MNKLVASGALIGASFGAFGCATEAVHSTGKCEAVAESGYITQARSYPVGTVAVRYHTGSSITNETTVESSIVKDGTHYYADLANLPTALDNEQIKGDWNENNTNAVVVVGTSGFEVGLTADCVHRDQLNENGISVVRLELPLVIAS